MRKTAFLTIILFTVCATAGELDNIPNAVNPQNGAGEAEVMFYDSVVASVTGAPVVLSDVVAESQFDEGRLFAMYSGQELEDAGRR